MTVYTFGSQISCPRLHISHMSTPKLHTSLAVEYFEVPECACSSGVIVHNSCMHMYTQRAVHFTGIFHPGTHSSHHQISPQGMS